jgi:hypothetical protein
MDCALNIIGAMLQFLENLVRISQYLGFFSDSSSWELTRSKASVASTRCGGQGGRAYIILLWLFNIWGTLNSTYSSLYAWAFLLFQTTKLQCSWNHGNCREYNKIEHIYYYVHVKAPCRPNPSLVWLLLANSSQTNLQVQSWGCILQTQASNFIKVHHYLDFTGSNSGLGFTLPKIESSYFISR